MPASFPNNMNATLPPVAVVGLGLIGTSLAKRLIAAGFTVHGYDVDASRTANLASLGGHAVASLAEAARAAHQPRTISGRRPRVVLVVGRGRVPVLGAPG